MSEAVPSRSTLSAPGRASAATFDEARRRTNVQGLKAASIVALVVVSAFAIVEYYVVPEHFYLLQVLRAICLLVLATAAYLAFRHEDWTRQHVDALTMAAFLTAGWYSIALMSLHDGYDSSFFLTLVFIIVGVGAVTLWPLKTALLYMALILASYLVPLLLGLVDLKNPDTFGIHLAFLFGMAVISVVAQQLRYQIEKREFATNQRLQETKASLEQTNERLKELDQLKTDFFANVSHELRTPLTLSLGPLQSLLKRDHADDEEQHLQALHRNQLRLLGLINQLLDLSKAESVGAQAEYSRQDVGALVRAIVDEVENAAKAKGLQLEVEVPKEPVFLYVDREKLEAVMLNLLSNAFKFTEQGGRIEVTVSEDTDTDVAHIAVRDTGTGIPESKLDAIFDRFAQADSSETRRYAGTGIGLALVKTNVELHGGAIEVQSEEGKGTTFTVTIPRGSAHLPADRLRDFAADPTAGALSNKAQQIAEFQEEPEVTLVTELPGALPSDAQHTDDHPREDADWLPELEHLNGAKPRVLVVDDTADMRRYLSSLLAPDYEVRTARDGAQGLEAAKAWDPDLVVSDVMMPVMSGPDMCKAIKEGGGRLSRTPVVLVTARAEEQTKLRGLDYGADDYLLKPFLQDELLLRVRNLVTKRRQERALFDAHLALVARHKYIQSDLELARDFQNDLLPELEMPEPLAAHVEFRPADVVGGDFYHLARLGEKRVRLLLADMVDHGVKAAVRAAAAWPEYTSLDQTNLSPAEALERLNDLATSKYADLSGSFLCLDLEIDDAGEVWAEYAQAGKMPFTLVSSAGAAPSPAAEGFIVGLFPEMSYHSKRLKIPPGTRLFLYTDGLYTQIDGFGSTFRESGLNDAWNTAIERSDIAAATKAVLASFDLFRGAEEQTDDVTLIGIEIGG
jgi:signal transduction histidine kinase/DNA-binding response OmpR family regulator